MNKRIAAAIDVAILVDSRCTDRAVLGAEEQALEASHASHQSARNFLRAHLFAVSVSRPFRSYDSVAKQKPRQSRVSAVSAVKSSGLTV